VLPQLLANGLVNGCLFALVAIGFALIYNTTRIFHVAFGATYAVAGYFCYFFLIQLQWGTPLSVVVTVVLTATIGILTERFMYAPLERRNASPLVALLSSLGLNIVIINLLALFFGNETKVLRPAADVTYRWQGVVLTSTQLAQIITALILLPTLLLVLRFSRVGKMIRAVRDNPTLAQIMGANLWFVRAVVFASGSALAGVGAALSALDVGIDLNVGMSALLIAAVALIIGGVGTFEGPVIGAFLLGVLQSLVVWVVSARWVDAVTFSLLIFFLIFRPEGLIGKRRRVEEVLS
jgi:branched-chain amino acid transport system permease protein